MSFETLRAETTLPRAANMRSRNFTHAYQASTSLVVTSIVTMNAVSILDIEDQIEMQAGKHDGDEHNAVQPHGELMAEHAFEPAAHGGERRNQRIEPACHHDECERDNADQRPERDLARCFRR